MDPDLETVVANLVKRVEELLARVTVLEQAQASVRAFVRDEVPVHLRAVSSPRDAVPAGQSER